MNSHAPSFAIKIASGDYNEINHQFKVDLTIGSVLFLFGSTLVLTFVYLLNHSGYYEGRFLILDNLILLVIIEGATFVYGLLAIYTRCFKVEVFHKYGVIHSIFMVFFLLFLYPLTNLKTVLIFIAAFQWLVLIPYSYILFSPFYKKIQ